MSTIDKDDRMIRNIVAYDSDGQRKDAINLEQISDVLASDTDCFVWVGLYQPDATLLFKLQDEFGLHQLAVEDALKAHQRPKIELYGDCLFIVAHTAQVIGNKIEFGESHLFIGPRYFLTIRHGASLSYAFARERCEKSPELLKIGPSYAAYSVLDSIVDNYFPIVEEFQTELFELEKDIFESQFKRDTIKYLYDLKRDLTKLRLAASPMQDIMSQLMHHYPELIRHEVKVYLRDVHDHVVRVNEATDTLREMLTAAMSVNLSLVTVQQGEIVKRLAGWAGLLAAPTLVASWYGMNFKAMPELHGKYSYWILIGVTVTFCTGLYWFLRKRKWL